MADFASTASLQAALALDRTSGCHPSFSFFMCTLLFPKCEDDQLTLPCRELCNEVKTSCESPLQAIGEEWPRSCEELPSWNDEKCLEPTRATPGICEPMPANFKATCEPLTGYSTVSFPNSFGHVSYQDVVSSSEFTRFASILDSISRCYPNARAVFCRMFVPQCQNDTQIQLCRNVCEEINASCTPFGLSVPFSCDIFPDRDVDTTCSPVVESGCEPIRYGRCQGLSYSQTTFQDLDIAFDVLPAFSAFDYISDCHPDFNFFLCSYYFPQCTSEGQILPCRSFCYVIDASCDEQALAAGISCFKNYNSCGHSHNYSFNTDTYHSHY
ncbi:uncharacterized protein [Branchiostoma lanceolatum]|uniref:uncharacterized protein n=1 Tax=Branchiostoma lanceolatum TaxID=7740 RepID=UPI00345458CC